MARCSQLFELKEVRNVGNRFGGGYTQIKTVLDAVGKNYVVESWVSEDGLQRYQRWSDGKIEVHMEVSTTVQETAVTFPIAFQGIPVCNAFPIEPNVGYYLRPMFNNWSTTGVSVLFTARSGDMYTIKRFMLTAIGY